MGDEEGAEPVFDFGAKKKSKKKTQKEKEKVEEEGGADGENVLVGVEGWAPGPVFEYSEMLNRLYEIIEAKNPSLSNKERYVLKPPQCVRVGSKRVAWVNFSEICGMMKRPVEHVVQFVLAEFGDDEEGAEPVFDFGAKKKSKKKSQKEKEKVEEEGGADGGDVLVGVEGWAPGPVFEYSEMLNRLYEIIEAKNPSLSNKERYVLKPPQCVRVGSKRVAWVNFSEICGMMKRPVEHVVQFVLAEFGTEGSIAGAATTRSEGQGQDGQLILKGRYLPKHCESLLRKYIKEYVTCEMCKSA
eukprot:CAMPEP_0172779258 /NCGR_PEP_ID=MMETSP1074-20121228/202330_1 /TAXON_ID=2916 /ORGANISM="Ceratium fusus, Strain PA161109" /LENGTH=298 /DNA_ID=CAMNT_0013616217 /DNA_START=59 /DNA_END=950 /DNA_ORIENTATION=+